MKKHLAQVFNQLDTSIGKINQRDTKIISQTLISRGIFIIIKSK